MATVTDNPVLDYAQRLLCRKWYHSDSETESAYGQVIAYIQRVIRDPDYRELPDGDALTEQFHAERQAHAKQHGWEAAWHYWELLRRYDLAQAIVLRKIRAELPVTQYSRPNPAEDDRMLLECIDIYCDQQVARMADYYHRKMQEVSK